MFSIFGQTGGHALNIMADLDHESRVDEVITFLNQKVALGEDPNDWLNYALDKACLDPMDLTDVDTERMIQEVRF